MKSYWIIYWVEYLYDDKRKLYLFKPSFCKFLAYDESIDKLVYYNKYWYKATAEKYNIKLYIPKQQDVNKQ